MHKLSRSILLTIFLLISGFAKGALVNEQKLKLEDEKNTVSIFQNSVNSVVHISNIRIARRGWFQQVEEKIPAGAGSGFVWDKEGHIVTNAHVVSGGDEFMVRFHKDTKEYRAKLVGGAPTKDIAVLKLIKSPKKLHPIQIGSSKNLIVGQKALAIGNPFGLDHTLTTGIVSALDRKIRGFSNIKIFGMIQTDTSINPGNSGGPLLNSSGELIGVNTMIYSNSGSSAGVGFAVPIDTVARLVPQLIKHKKIIQPGLGIAPLQRYYYDTFGVKDGLVVKYVNPDSPASKAGLKGIEQDRNGYYLGDVIIAVNSKQIKDFDDIYNILGNYSVGETVNVTVKRGKKTKDLKIKLIQVNE